MIFSRALRILMIFFL